MRNKIAVILFFTGILGYVLLFVKNCACSEPARDYSYYDDLKYINEHYLKRNGTTTTSPSENKTTSTTKKSYSSTKETSTSKSKSYNKSKNTKTSNDRYDEGYNDIYEEDDYDWDRYYKDDDYAMGVDDAIDDIDWE